MIQWVMESFLTLAKLTTAVALLVLAGAAVMASVSTIDRLFGGPDHAYRVDATSYKE